MPFDIKERLTAKLGPLPVWGWAAIGGVGVGAVMIASSRGNASASDSGTSDSSKGAKGAPVTKIVPVDRIRTVVQTVVRTITVPSSGSTSGSGTTAPTTTTTKADATLSGGGTYTLTSPSGMFGTQIIAQTNPSKPGTTQGLTLPELVTNPLQQAMANLSLTIQRQAAAPSGYTNPTTGAVERIAPSQVGTGVVVGQDKNQQPVIIYLSDWALKNLSPEQRAALSNPVVSQPTPTQSTTILPSPVEKVGARTDYLGPPTAA